MTWSPFAALYAAAYALIMSILLFTFASWLHCHPVLIGSASLLPVANVVLSSGLKLPFALVWKSRAKTEAVKPPGRTATGFPDASKKSA
jgi:hypothetical protein